MTTPSHPGLAWLPLKGAPMRNRRTRKGKEGSREVRECERGRARGRRDREREDMSMEGSLLRQFVSRALKEPLFAPPPPRRRSPDPKAATASTLRKSSLQSSTFFLSLFPFCRRIYNPLVSSSAFRLSIPFSLFTRAATGANLAKPHDPRAPRSRSHSH